MLRPYTSMDASRGRSAAHARHKNTVVTTAPTAATACDQPRNLGFDPGGSMGLSAGLRDAAGAPRPAPPGCYGRSRAEVLIPHSKTVLRRVRRRPLLCGWCHDS